MPHQTSRGSMQSAGPDADTAWQIVLAAARSAESANHANQLAAFAIADDGELRSVGAGDPDAIIAWQPGVGWKLLLSPADARHPSIDLYLPICSATSARPMTIGHLGQSLDGFIATHAGES